MSNYFLRTRQFRLPTVRTATERKPMPAVVALLVTPLFLSACASFSPDGGLNDVSAMTSARIGQPVSFSKQPAPETEQTVSALLAKPLNADSAVQIALLNNAGFKAALAGLGIAEADLVRAGRMRNPGFSFARLQRGDEVEIDRSILFDLTGLLTIPLRTGIEQRRFERARQQTALQAVQLASATRRAWFNAVAAAQTVRYMEQVSDAAQSSAELAQRMARAGNFSKLDQLREQAFHGQALAQVARARHQAVATREELTRLLGLQSNEASFTLPERLPDMPAAPRAAGALEAEAMQQRLDVQMARSATESTARALGLDRATGFINVFELGYINKSESGKSRSDGYEVSLEVPLFDWGGARIARAESAYMQSVHETAALAARARSEVRQSWSAYRTAYDVARQYRDEVVPLRRKISEELLLRYNGMLVSVFELLADAREQIASVNTAIETQRNFWIADNELQTAVNGGGSLAGSGTGLPSLASSISAGAGSASSSLASPAAH